MVKISDDNCSLKTSEKNTKDSEWDDNKRNHEIIYEIFFYYIELYCVYHSPVVLLWMNKWIDEKQLHYLADLGKIKKMYWLWVSLPWRVNPYDSAQ